MANAVGTKNKDQRAEYARSIYVDGNTARWLEPEQQKQKSRKQPNEAVARNRQRNPQMDRNYVLFLALVCAAAMFACVHYLRLKSELIAQSNHIASMEKELSQKIADNDAYYNETISSVDLEKIRKIAVERLGMKYAKEEQIIYYTPDSGNYVRQYQDVPTE